MHIVSQLHCSQALQGDQAAQVCRQNLECVIHHMHVTKCPDLDTCKCLLDL